MIGETCNTCRYFIDSDQEHKLHSTPRRRITKGICVRFPPSNGWPATESHRYCGEFKSFDLPEEIAKAAKAEPKSELKTEKSKK